MPWNKFLSVAIPCGLVTSLDIGLSNLALVRITITFYTMIKSSSPIFVVISAYMFGLEKITLALILTVLIICAGEFLTVLGEVEFDTIGFILVLTAAVLSGMRWTVVQLKIQCLDPPIKSTIATMRILSPFMFISMLTLSFLVENPWKALGPGSNTSYFESPTAALSTISLGLIGAILAICMIICEFYLIMKSSAIVLMIGGVCKELTTIILGVAVMHDNLNAINILGCSVVFSGVLLYKVSLYVQKIEKQYDSVEVNSTGSAAMFSPDRDLALDQVSSRDDDLDVDGGYRQQQQQQLDLDESESSRRTKQEPLVQSSSDAEII